MINLLRTLSFGYIRLHVTRTALIVLSIALGVTALVATQAIGRSLKVGIQDAVNPLAGLADLLVVNGQAGVPAEMAERIRAMGIAGVADARPFVFTRLALADLDNRPCWLLGVEISEKQLSANDLGARTRVTYQPKSLLEGLTLATAVAKGEVAFVSPFIADSLPGREVRLRNAGQVQAFLLLGTVDFSHSQLPVRESPVVVLDLNAASRVCFPEKPGRAHQINVTLTPGTRVDEVQAELQRRLGDEADVQTADASRELVSDVVAGLEIGLAVGGVGALIIGLFLVYNVLSVSVAERRHDIGIMRAVGATRWQVAGLFLGEAALLGLAGSLLGLPAGWGLASLVVSPLAATISEAIVAVDAGSTVVSLPAWLMAAAAFAGVVVACGAALVPALQAAGEEPADAVRRVPRRPGYLYVVVQLAAVSILAGVGGGMVLWREALPRHVGMFAGIVALLLSGLVAMPLLAAVAGKAIQPLFRHLLGLEGRLAADNLVNAPGRTGLVIAALAATGALLVQTCGFLKSTREAVTEWVDEKIAADLFVTAGSAVTSAGNALAMREGLAAEIATVPGVDVVMPVRFHRIDWVSPRDGEKRIIFLAALEPEAFDDKPGHVLGASFQRLPQLRERGKVAVSENFAALHGVGVGSRIQIPALEGVVEAEVIGTVVDYSWNRGTVVLSRGWLRELYQDHQVDVLDIFLKPGVSKEAVRSEIEKRFGRTEAVFVTDRDEVRKGVADGLNKLYSVAYAQQAIIGVVALLGVVSALFISVLQRRRELGLLRAVGATRGQVMRTVLAEAVLMGAVGAVVGLAIGLVLEWYVIHVMIFDESGFYFPMRIPWTEAGAVSLGCVISAALAGLWPAWMATTDRITDAIAYE
jgi:putative ABC transport system permease protein